MYQSSVNFLENSKTNDCFNNGKAAEWETKDKSAKENDCGLVKLIVHQTEKLTQHTCFKMS